MDTFALTFDALPEGGCSRMMDAPPRLRLAGPEHGWIDLVVGEEGGEFAPVTLSQVYPPLDDLWAWSLAVAWGLMPVTVRLDEESNLVHWVAEALPDGRLRIGLVRAHGYLPPDEAAPEASLCWLEPRQDFLRRWGAMWADFLGDGFDQAQWDNDPEPMRDMPWGALADVPALEPPPWTREQRIAWFYLVMAYHLRSRGHGCEYLDDPVQWTLRELAFARLAIATARAAWGQLREDAPPATDALRLIDDAHAKALHDPQVWAQDEQKRRLSLSHAYYDAIESVFDHIAAIVAGCLSRLPFAPGSFIADERGRRARILRVQGREWLLYWEDGRITLEDAFHAASHPTWRWPVAHGPDFDPKALDAIERREWRFHELGVSPVGIVCPVCGYPCLDDDTAEVQSCEFCGFALWTILSGDCPPMDAASDADDERPTLRQLRANFLRWGHVWPPEEPIRPHSSRAIEAQPAYRRLVREAMAEWDAWLENPDPDHTPEEVWRRWRRWQDEQRRKGGHDDA